jgi:predicted ATP-grasp superfamily ATP-dependent carboligase
LDEIEENEVPVTILGVEGGNHGLGVTRSLGRLGIPVYVIGLYQQQIAFLSRYCRKKVCFNAFGFNERSARDLLAVGREIGQKSILMSTGDRGAVFINDHVGVLSKRFIFPNQTDVASSMSNKKAMYYLAKENGIPTAGSVFPDCREDVMNFREIPFPLMLKPICGWLPPRKKVIVHNNAELLNNYDAMANLEKPNLMLQEYIPGEDDRAWIFHGYFNQDSDCLFGFSGMKMRQWPAYHGITSLGVCLQNATVRETAKRFMKAIGYRGIVDIDCRYDPRDGRYKILDVNPRIGGNFRIFVTNDGMDVARALYLDMTGQQVRTGIPPEGRKWLSEDLEVRASILYHKDGNLPLKKWVNSYGGVREMAIFAFDDPNPFLHSFLIPSLHSVIGKISVSRHFL